MDLSGQDAERGGGRAKSSESSEPSLSFYSAFCGRRLELDASCLLTDIQRSGSLPWRSLSALAVTTTTML